MLGCSPGSLSHWPCGLPLWVGSSVGPPFRGSSLPGWVIPFSGLPLAARVKYCVESRDRGILAHVTISCTIRCWVGKVIHFLVRGLGSGFLVLYQYFPPRYAGDSSCQLIRFRIYLLDTGSAGSQGVGRKLREKVGCIGWGSPPLSRFFSWAWSRPVVAAPGLTAPLVSACTKHTNLLEDIKGSFMITVSLFDR